MQRTEGWEERLAGVIAAARRRPFAWGAHDCLLFPADAVAALIGIDPASAWRGTYEDELGAWRLLRDYVGAEMPLAQAMRAVADRIAREIGARPATAAFARRGDIALVDGVQHDALAVVDMNARHLLAISPDGLARLPLAAGLAFWAVG